MMYELHLNQTIKQTFPAWRGEMIPLLATSRSAKVVLPTYTHTL